jgi:CRP-like cAMP-binding protein
MKVTIDELCFKTIEVDEKLSQRSMLKSFDKNEFIYEKGEKPKGIYFIKRGLVGLFDISINGNESLLRVFGDKFTLGHRTFISEEEYHASAKCLLPSKVLFLPLDSPDELFQLSPNIYKHITLIMARDLRIAEERINDSIGKRVSNRIIETLIYLKTKHPDYQWTRREIGEYCGAKTETVTRVLSQLEKQNFIQKEGRDIIIKDKQKLLEYSEDSELNEA